MGLEQALSSQERYGGIYLGDDVAEEDTDQEFLGHLSFDYVIHRYGDDKKKGKKSKPPPLSDESRFFQTMSAMSSENAPPESNVKTKFFDIDNSGYMYEKDESLLSGLDRLNHNQVQPTSSLVSGGIYLGDESIPFSGQPPPEYSSIQSFEQFAPYLSGLNRDTDSLPPPYDEKRTPVRTKAIFDEAGIYLGVFVIITVV